MSKILVFSLAYFPFVGGAEVALREIMKRLKHKYEFEVVTARMGFLPSREKIDGIQVRRVGVGIAWIDKWLVFLPACILYGLFHKADLVFGLLENQAAIAARFVSWVKGVRCVINLQSGDSEEYIYRKLGPFGFLYDLVYGGRAEYVVLSEYLRQRAIRHGVPSDRITVIPNGVDLDTFTCKGIRRTERRKSVITVSRLTLKNGVDDIVKALPLVKKSFPDAVLTVCGVGEDELKLRNLIQKLGVSESVRFVGLLRHKDLPKYLCNADVFVRPSLSEGFGNSFVEALACGVPIIGTKVGGIPDFLVDRKTGLFCKVRDSEDLAEKIKLLLGNRKLGRTIVKNGQRMIKRKYEWSIIARQFDEVLA
jgi:glycosyltransferase involved in cell wall biosynthesis